MIGLLRADRIRLRNRLDIWIVGFAVPLLAALGFAIGYVNVPNHFFYDETQPMPPEVAAQILVEQSHYAFPYSIVTVLDSVPWVFIALFFMTVMTIGGEYDWGTIRTSLLAKTDRRRFLASRFIALLAIAIAMTVLLLALALMMPGLLAVTGHVLPASVAVGIRDVGVAIAACLLVVAFVVAFAMLLTVLTRNPVFPILFGLIYFVVEGIITSLSFFQDPAGPRWLARAFPLQSVSGLIGDSFRALTTDLSTTPIDASGPVVWPLWVSFVVVGGWLVLFYFAADRIFSRSDITE